MNIGFIPTAAAAHTTNTQIVELGGTNGAGAEQASVGQALAVELTSPTGGATTITLNFNGAGTVATSQTIASTYGSNTCTTIFGGVGTQVYLPGTPTAAGSGSVITVSGLTALFATPTHYCFFLTSITAYTNGTAGVYPVLLTAGSDSQSVQIDVLATGLNAITVSGTVAPVFTMTLGTNADALGTLVNNAVTTSTGVTTTIATNALTGWYVWAEDSQAGLHSTLAAHTITSVTPGTAFAFGSHTTSEEYGLSVTSGTNTTVPAAYLAGSNNGSGLATGTYNQIASYASAPTGGSTFTTKELVDIASTTPAATDYSDIVTLIGAGSF